MTVTEGKKKKPPTFHYLPKSRAQQLKKSWVQDRKIRSKWRAQKKREGLTNQTNESADEEVSSHVDDQTNAESQSDSSLHHLAATSASTSSQERPSLRDLRKMAYTSKPSLRFHTDRGGNTTVGREKRQPNMKLRMNVLLEKIKRDFS